MVGAGVAGSATGAISGAGEAGSSVGGSAAGSSSAFSIQDSGGTSILDEPGMTMTDTVIDQIWNILNWKESKRRYADQLDMARDPYTYAVQSLKNAGLNPMLAAGGGIKSPGMPTMSIPSNNKSAMAEKRAMQLNSASQAAATSAQVKLATSNAALNTEKILTERSLQNTQASSARKLDADKLLSEQLAIKAATDTRLATANEARTVEETRRAHYDNWKNEAQKWIYEGKKGKFIGFADWLLDKYNKVRK